MKIRYESGDITALIRNKDKTTMNNCTPTNDGWYGPIPRNIKLTKTRSRKSR